MAYTQSKQHVEALIDRAAKAANPDEAMKYAQAALNAANALCSLEAMTNAR